MRRFLYSTLALALASLAGCHSVHDHGICDTCDLLDDHCCSRAPWVNAGPLPANIAHPNGSVPAKLPVSEPRTLPESTGPARGL